MTDGSPQDEVSPANARLLVNWPGWILIMVLALLALTSFRDYGYSWDEIYQDRGYGQAVIRFISTLGEDRSAINTHDHHLYGGTFDTLAELLVSVSPLAPRNSRHLANVLAGLAGIIGCWRLGRHLGGPLAGFWAALFLAVSAPWYGHMFINAKDIPFAAGMIWSLYLLLRLIEGFPNPPRRSRVLLGIVLGLTLGVRIGGILLLFYFGVAALGYWFTNREGSSDVPKDFSRFALNMAITGGTVVLVAWVLMIACWPAALLSPVALPLEAIRAANRFQWEGIVLWNGRELFSTDLPWNYLPIAFAVQLPEVLTLLFGLSLIWGTIQSVRGKSGKKTNANTVSVPLLLLAVVFPVGWAIAMGSTTYDNGRHFLFVLPPLACLSGLCWSSFLDWAAQRRAWAKPLMVVGMFGALLMPVVDMVSLHPYQYTYLNAFAGGMPEAAQRFDTDYWITSYREASFALIDHARKAAAASKRPFDSTGFSVAVCGPPEILDEALPSNFSLTMFDPEIRTNYLVASTRWHGDQLWPDWQTVAEVRRKGMRYAVVKADPAIARLVNSAPSP